jgi:putative hydrolase of the HAD superfamily
MFDHAQSARQMAEVAGSDEKSLRRIVYESDLEHRYETGLITGDEFVDEIAAALDRSLDTAAMLEAASAMFRPNFEMLRTLQTIRQKGIRMGLLSNTNAAHWDWICRRRYAVVEGWFDPVVLSYEVNLMKPDTKIYEHSTALVGIEPSEIFFTDDRLDNIEGAERFGWQTRQFISAEDLLLAVEAW